MSNPLESLKLTRIVKLVRTNDGYRTPDDRFEVLRRPGRSFTLGPFKNYWDVLDRLTQHGRTGLASLRDVREFIGQAYAADENNSEPE